MKKYTPFISVIIMCLLYLALTYMLRDMPYGFFTDEIRIGYVAWEISQGNFSSLKLPLFYEHYEYTLGILPPLLTSPIIMIFGLSELTTRIGSSLYALVGLVLTYFTLRLMRFKFNLLTIVIVFFTPVFFHLSRVQFGHAHSFFVFSLGLYIYVKAVVKNTKSYWPFFLSGLVFGLSSFGYSSFIIQTPLFVGSLILLESVSDRKILIKLLVLSFGFIIIYSSFFFYLLVDQSLLQRYVDKIGSSKETYLERLVGNYPKYYDIGFLILHGEYKSVDSQPILRHMFMGSGIILASQLILIILSLITANYKSTDIADRIVRICIVWAILTPLADIATTTKNTPPYSFTMYALVFALVFLVAYGLNSIIQRINAKKSKMLTFFYYTVLVVILILFTTEVVSTVNKYKRYSYYSSGYWGWQWGPKEIISYFKTQEKMYDKMYIEPTFFNETADYINFYNVEYNCKKCSFGFLSDKDDMKELIAVSIPSYVFSPIYQNMKVIKLIKYPQGDPAFVMLQKN